MKATLTKEKVTCWRLAEIILEAIAQIDVSERKVRGALLGSDIYGEVDEWFVKNPPTDGIRIAIDRLKLLLYELID